MIMSTTAHTICSRGESTAYWMWTLMPNILIIHKNLILNAVLFSCVCEQDKEEPESSPGPVSDYNIVAQKCLLNYGCT